MSETRASIGYRPGLDGVRALAVIAVMLYHENVSWARGGFLGVDVFFVLSGYLITSLLMVELRETGGIDRLAFWTRRARRLLPALFLMLVGVAIYAAVWADPTQLDRVRWDGIATLFYVSNWRFVLDGASYFQAFQAPSPLQHTWSLAIEEQWYLAWPLILLALWRLTRRRPPVLAAAVGVLALGSAALTIALYHPGADPSRLYYGTDTRAQELLVGALLGVVATAIAPVRVRLGARARAVLTQMAGVAAVVGLGFAVVQVRATNGFLYRGGFLLVAVAAAALVIAASTAGAVARVLSWRPLRAIGAISYGLYLWHWPVDVALTASRAHVHGAPLIALHSAASVALATGSYFAIERPVRRHGLRGVWFWPRAIRRPVIIPGLAALLVVALVVSTRGAQPFARPPAPKPRASSGLIDDLRPDPNRARILLLGDSQIYTMIFWDAGAFKQSGPQYDFGPVIGCGVFDPGVGEGSNCTQREQLWRVGINRFDPDLSVLLIGAWETLDFRVNGHLYRHDTPAHERELEAIFEGSVRELTARGGRVAFLEVPCFGVSPSDDEAAHIRADPAAVANVNTALRAVAARDPRQATFVPWASAICPGGHYVEKIDGIDVRPDGVHFGNTPAANLAVRVIAPILRRLATTARAARRAP